MNRLPPVSWVALLLLWPHTARAQANCPWITTGTVNTFLGGESAVQVQSGQPPQGTCLFTRSSGQDTEELRIVVQKRGVSELPVCPQDPAKLVGIGNEATYCSMPAKPGEEAAQISGRLRDLGFVMTLTLRGPQSSAMPTKDRQQILERTAQIVTGNLY